MKFLKSLTVLVLFCSPAFAAGEDNPFHVTDFPLPRFVSLSSNKVFVRTGPGKTYPVRWEYSKKGLPVEIILEFDNWRKIKDSEGKGGWIHKVLLSGKRNAIVKNSVDITPLYRAPDGDSKMVARVQNGAIVGLDSCGANWCNVSSNGYSGWIEKKSLWGVYANEEIE